MLWLLVHALPAGLALVALTGLLEGPGLASQVALRRRHAPPELRAKSTRPCSAPTTRRLPPPLRSLARSTTWCPSSFGSPPSAWLPA